MAMDFVAGCIGGCAGVVVGHPFDSIKVRLQTQDVRNPAYRGTFHCFQTLVKNESALGLFRGISSPLAGVAVINALVFGVQANMQRSLPNPESLASHFISGATAGVVQSIFCSPMEMVKTQVQIQQEKIFKGPWDCLKKTYHNDGLRGVQRGLSITALREGLGFGVYFYAYELLTKSDNNKPITTSHMLMAGGTAGSLSWFFAYPIDVIKTRLQADGMLGPRVYKNAVDCFVQTVRGEGFKSLTKGLSLTLVRAFPVNAATWAAVTWVIRLSEEAKHADSSYKKLSELREAASYLPDLKEGFYAQASGISEKKLPHQYWDREGVGRSPITSVCSDYLHSFDNILQTIPQSLSKS